MSAEAELNETDLELISASLDEDLSEFERRRLNTTVLAKNEGEKTWVRYNAISAVMKKQFPAQIDKDFSAQVMQAIGEQGYQQDEESATQVKIKRVSSHLKQVAGLAVAASVAAFSVVTYQHFNQPANTESPQVALSTQEASSEINSSAKQAIQAAQQVEFAPATAQQSATALRPLDSFQVNNRPADNQQNTNTPLQQSRVEENIYYQELNPYIQRHAGYGSQRIISPYVEIIELKDIKE